MDLDDLPTWLTGAIFIGMIVVGFLPKIPVWVKIPLQVVVACVIYFKFGQATFNLPYGESLPTSTFFGGATDYVPGFNKDSVGFLSGALGVVCSLIYAGIAFLVGKIRKGGDPE